ncbi:hypothetical protein [Curtobacterium pusillum]|nr:hypothetical protein [Curtobacterium pusillum]
MFRICEHREIMNKVLAPIALAAVLALTGCAGAGTATSTTTAASDETPKVTPTPTPKPAPDLVGEWKQNNSKSSDGWMSATITSTTITANFVTDGGDTVSLFWVGTYTAPGDATSPYTWTSTRDKAATDSALLASTDDTKVFTYEDGELSFPVSIAGSSTTVRLSKV